MNSVEMVLIFSVVIVAIFILILLVLLIFITVSLTKRISELSKSFGELVSTFAKKSAELLDQAKVTVKTVESSLAGEKETETQRLIRGIFKSAVFIFEIINMYQKLRRGGNRNGKGSG